MDDEEQNMINLIVDTISEEVDCYDINRDGLPGLRTIWGSLSTLPYSYMARFFFPASAEDVPTRVLGCHTTLLVITSRFIECAERQFDSEQVKNL